MSGTGNEILVLPARRAALYIGAALLLGVAQGLGQNFPTANLAQVQGEFAVTRQEAMWLVAAYMIPSASLTLALVKVRTQFGLRLFTQVGLAVFVLSALLNVVATDLHSGIAVRFLSGAAAASMSTMAFLYMLEPFAQKHKLSIGLSLALVGISAGPSIARVVSPYLLDAGGWHNLTLVELGLAMIALCTVHLLPLTPVPREKVIERWDFISFPLIFAGLGCLATVLVTGTTYWWLDRAWLGWTLAAGIAALALAVVIELNRKDPLVDIRWILSPTILQFAGALLVFRIVLAEQTSGAPGLFMALGLQNEQLRGLFGMIVAVTVLGGLVSAAVLKPGREHAIHAVALVLIIIGAWMDAHSTNQTRPAQMMFSQALIAFASALFLPAALAAGMMAALKKGPKYILSFIIVFLVTQRIGGLAGSALYQTLLQFRQNAHVQALAAQLPTGDPLVTERMASYAQPASQMGQIIQREATVLAYNDIFLMLCGLATVALTVLLAHWALLLRKSRMSATQV